MAEIKDAGGGDLSQTKDSGLLNELLLALKSDDLEVSPQTAGISECILTSEFQKAEELKEGLLKSRFSG